MDVRFRSRHGSARPSLPYHSRRLKQAGFTLFELVVAIIVMSYLGKVFFDRFLVTQEMAEKVAMEQTVGAIKSGLAIQMAGLLLQGREKDLPLLSKINPIRVLSEPPANYLGEVKDSTSAQIPAGSWYFDQRSLQLVYRPKRQEHLVAKMEDRVGLRYRVHLEQGDLLDHTRPGNQVVSVTLESVSKFAWNFE